MGGTYRADVLGVWGVFWRRGRVALSTNDRSLCRTRAVLFLSAVCSLSDAACAQNLTGDVGVHDPSTNIEIDGRHYLFYTGNRVRSKYSDDLFEWQEGPRVFASRPEWTLDIPNNNGTFWAPDVAYFNDRYHLYYSVSSFGSQESAIGLATNPTLDPDDPEFAWTDQGPVIQSMIGSLYNTIDPSIIQTSDGEIRMTFGSFWEGIYQVPIDPATGKLPSRFVTHHLASNSQIEAAYVYERDDYYYLFVNWGSCCSGTDSTYNIRVGRSMSVDGQFIDQSGRDLADGGGTLFLATEGDLIGPGHISIFQADEADWFSYHYYDGDDFGRSKLNIRSMQWTADGWPVAGPAFPVPEPSGCGLVLFAALVATHWRCFRGIDRLASSNEHESWKG